MVLVDAFTISLKSPVVVHRQLSSRVKAYKYYNRARRTDLTALELSNGDSRETAGKYELHMKSECITAI